ncbi:MAG: Asp-tRNA(Asn)/Glu-tRNA(Gln) amidotransferase subunit GatA [bacterium]|nr:Asp-tRNA(Asn)/Glu-tRNA(Gln) amidotransferase subunit GatA [bacterium]
MNNLSIKKIHEGLKAKEFSAVELVKFYLSQIEKKDKEIGAFLTITDELALTQAEVIDDSLAKGENIPLLAGIPVSVKDNILIEGIKNTCASKILENYIAPYDATVIEKLKNQGAVFLGKTNLDEFAMGSSTENSAFKVTKNPRDLERVAGGSSGGSAAAVAADFCCYALGSDTGGSIRQPASFCGVVGLKPTYGAVSRYGLTAFASSLDQIGPITKTAEDAEIIFNAIKGKDARDSTSVNSENSYRNIFREQFSESKIGIPKEYFVDGIDKEVRTILEGAIEKIREMGAKIVEISLPHSEYAMAVYYIIACSEASANLARFDGIKYGFSAKGDGLLDVYIKSKSKGFGIEVKRRIMLGTYSLSSGYYDAFYSKAQKARNLIRKDFAEAFKKVDAIFAPVAPTPAFKIGEKTENPLSMYLSDIFTVSANLAGIPAISVPIDSNSGLPVGLQIMANHFEEEKLFELAKIYK